MMQEYDDPKGTSSLEIGESLKLPSVLDQTVLNTAQDVDAFVQQEGTTGGTLSTMLTAHREAGWRQLLTVRGNPQFSIPISAVFDPDRYRWPASLYIPNGADAHDYWIGDAPGDHRYSLDWTSPATATANRASRQDGTLFSVSQLDNSTPGRSQASESGVGILYKPHMTLGVVDLQPKVNCTGTLRTFLQFFPQLAAGYVEIKADLLLAAWQQIPNGFDLLSFKSIEVATSGRRDQSFGPELQPFQRSFDGPPLSAPFVVQGGRTYLLGVVSRITVISTLTSNAVGGTFGPVSNTLLRVWGTMNCVVPEINVLTQRVDIP
jgi:hypothetical protein